MGDANRGLYPVQRLESGDVFDRSVRGGRCPDYSGRLKLNFWRSTKASGYEHSTKYLSESFEFLFTEYNATDWVYASVIF